MRRYTADEEERVRLQAAVGNWARAGILNAAQAAHLDAQLQTDLKRTNVALRATLAVFTALILGAAVALTFVSFHIHGAAASATTFLLWGLVSFAIADYLAGTLRLYRYGVEETAAALSAVLVSAAALAFVNAAGGSAPHLDMMIALSVGAAAAWVVYLRFGFVYAAVAATICAGLVPSQFTLPDSARRICAAAIFAAVFVVARTSYRRQEDDFPGGEHAAIEAAACLAAYLSLNLHAFDELASWLWSPHVWDQTAFYWATFAATWLIPAAALADAIRAKDRALLAAGIMMALVTLATSKPYLGRLRQTWDPMLLGVTLAGGAVALRRWIASGPDGRRNGYTVDRLQARELDLLKVAANASVVWQDRVHGRPDSEAAPSPFGGGRSGGGGAGASY